MSDYNRELRMEVDLRITDRLSTPYPGGAGPGTGSFTLGWSVPCWRTPDDTTKGGDCAIAFKMDSLLPGSVTEKVRSVWQIQGIRLYDGGADQDGDTTADNKLFAVPGLFVP
jgi:hypothetical protein